MSAPVITDRADPRYAGALTRRCPICKAKVGKDCHNPLSPGQLLPGRLVHIARMEDEDQ
ncbi:zinc finger domain-containing protein [Mycobacteroides abscessus]|uniref:zinc finger domain-containing protein n=1 Tax=Mycobacteroides abscessus TaxID=36809 RepID=UPI0009C7CA33|nr:hypothetical protein [Mycobacteroides abscessus]SLF39785.1 Uncharacterised protein [Mycobacteroides abscessus subsp. bolletii]